MLYLVSGASRSGKTTVARKILDLKGIPYLSLDWIVMGFTNGMPECGIHDKLFPDEIAERLRTFLEAMCESMLWTEQDCVVEGEAILPKTARILLDRHPQTVRACFLGFADIGVDEKLREIKTHRGSEPDWLLKESDETIRRHIQNMVEYSRKVERQCAGESVRYFDTSADFLKTVEGATQYLLSVDGN